MAVQKKLSRSLFSIVASLLLLISQNYLAVFAKGAVQALPLEKTTINASVVDLSNNLLRITNGVDLNPLVSIKPDRTTLANGKAVKIQGTIENGTLVIDLTRLGPANLLPRGKYIVIASRGTTKLRATFEIIPPTLIIGKLKIPVPASGENLARLKYQIASGTATSQEATVVLHEGQDFTNIASGSKGIKTKLTQVTENNEFTGKEEVSWQGQYIQEVNGETKNSAKNKPLFVEAVFNAQTSESGEEKQTSFSAPIALSKTNSKTNINNDNTLSPGSTAISKFIGAAYTLNEDDIEKSGASSPNYNFDKAITDLKDQFGDIGENKTIGQGYEDVETITQALGPSIANSLYKMYNGVSGTSGGVQTESSTSSGSQAESSSSGSDMYAEFALGITSIAPDLVQAPTTDTSDSDKLDNFLANPDPYVIGSTDESELNFDVPSSVSANIYKKVGAPLGAFKAILDEGESPRDAALGGGIAYELDSKSAFGELKQLREDIKDGATTGVVEEGFNTLSIYPGVEANVNGVITEANNSGDENFQINGLPGSIFKTDEEGTAPQASSNVKVNLSQGAITDPSIQGLSFVSISQDKNQYEGKSLNGLAVSDDIAVVPSSVAKRFPPGAQFVNSLGFQLASDKVFAAPKEGTSGETESSTSSGSSNKEIKSFNPVTQGQQFVSAFFGSGEDQNNFIKNSPAAFAEYLGNQAPPSLVSAITVPPPDVENDKIGLTTSVSDIVGDRGGSNENGENNDLASIFASGSSFGKKPRPSGGGFTSGSGGPTVIETNTGGTGNNTVILPGGGGLTPMPSGGKLP